MFEIVKGDDRPLRLQLFIREGSKKCGVRKFFNLTGVTEITAKFQNQDETFLEKQLTVSNGVVIDDALSGLITINWDEAETELLKFGKCNSFEVKILINTKTYTFQFIEVLDVKKSVFC